MMHSRPLKQAVVLAVDTLGMEGHVSFCGLVPYSQVVSYYQNADILVNPSLSESFGRSLIEAMSCCVPVVATRAGGMPDVVGDGKTGLLVESNDPDGLAGAILQLLSDDELRSSMGQAGRRRVLELFTWEKLVENLSRNYEEILESS